MASSTETAISLVIVVLNVVLKLFVRVLAAHEMRWTRSEMVGVLHAPMRVSGCVRLNMGVCAWVIVRGCVDVFDAHEVQWTRSEMVGALHAPLHVCGYVRLDVGDCVRVCGCV